MSLTTVIDGCSVGLPRHRDGLWFFPLYLHQAPLGLDAGPLALAAGRLVATERAAMEVPTLTFANTGLAPALLVVGQVVFGGWQDRMVTTTTVVGGGATIDVPVACVEAGRWSGRERFEAGTAMANRRLRRAAALTRDERGGADQRKVWELVDDALGLAGKDNPTRALRDALAGYGGDGLADVVGDGPLPGQCGLATAAGDRIAAIDLFDSADTLAAFWPSLVRSHTLDIPRRRDGRPSLGSVVRLVRRAGQTLHRVGGPGVGHHYTGTAKGIATTALEIDGRIAHLDVFAAA